MKALVIVESPGKVNTIQGYLGKDYTVKATVGHCFDIDKSNSAIDVNNKFKTKFSLIVGKKKVVDEIKSLAKSVDIVFIATDCDREGEAIGWHIAHKVIPKNVEIKRISFQEITKSAILKAIKNAGDFNENIFNAQQARCILDRLVGFKVSPLLWRFVASRTSAGRVQSVGLRFIVDRQKEIDIFKADEYWDISGNFCTAKKEKIEATYKSKEKLTNEKQVNEIITSVRSSKKWIAKKVSKTRKDRSSSPIFETATLQQFCMTTFGWTPKRTMQIAQKVYEAGLITYHRTDCLNISDEAIQEVRKQINSRYGSDYLPSKPRYFKSSKKAQEAHEGIRPTHPENVLEDAKYMSSEQFRLYEAIYRRFYACQMTNAQFDVTKITIEADKHTFVTSGQILVFDGFLKVYPYYSSKETILPDINEGDVLKLSNTQGNQHFTKPPPQYNGASLIKILKEKGIGRPSTYASILETLKRRKYVEGAKTFAPTALGKQVCNYLMKAFPELMKYDFTARVEDELDEIAQNNKVWQDVVQKFWNELEKSLKASNEIGKELRSDNVTEHDCPKCKKNKLVKRFSRYGTAFYGCKGYAKGDCSAMFSIGKNGEPIEVKREPPKYVEGKKCDCGGKIVIRKAKRTGKEFGGCENYPQCRKIYTLEGELIERKPRKFKK